MHGDYQFANVMYHHGGAGPAGRHRRLGDGHGRRSEARPGLGRADAGPRTPTAATATVGGYVDMRGMPSRARGPGPLRRGVGPAGRRHRLLRHPREVEAGHRPRAGLPARRRQPRTCRRSARSCSTRCRPPPSSPRRRTTGRDGGRRGAGPRAARRRPRPAPQPARRSQRAHAARSSRRLGQALVEAELDPEIRGRRPHRHRRPCVLRRDGPAVVRRGASMQEVPRSRDGRLLPVGAGRGHASR